MALLQAPSGGLAEGGTGPNSDAITVVAERLRDAKMSLTLNRFTGQLKCRLKQPSGDARIDAAACEITLGCARLQLREGRGYAACMATARDAFLDEYFADLEAAQDNSR
jgi:hypothetical protein